MVTKETTRILPDIAIPPGELLKETLDAFSMTQVELAARMGRPTTIVNEIIKGKKSITPDTAIQLEHVLGTPAHIWIGLERDFQLIKAKLDERDRLTRQVTLLRKYPVAAMVKEGWIERLTIEVRKVRELLRFFGVASLDEVKVVHAAAFRKARGKQASPEALAAWMRQGELQAEKVPTQPFDAASLKKSLPVFRAMTCESPEKFEPEVRERCAQCGVAWVVVPHLPKTHVNGAVWWEGDHYVVEMSLRFKWNDVFWFTFFHELGHVLLHGKRSVFIDLEGAGSDSNEDEANEFAANVLISKREYTGLVRAGRFTWNRVREFARNNHVHPGIVVGRLQNDGHIGRDRLNGLRERFKLMRKGN